MDPSLISNQSPVQNYDRNHAVHSDQAVVELDLLRKERQHELQMERGHLSTPPTFPSFSCKDEPLKSGFILLPIRRKGLSQHKGMYRMDDRLSDE